MCRELGRARDPGTRGASYASLRRRRAGGGSAVERGPRRGDAVDEPATGPLSSAARSHRAPSARRRPRAMASAYQKEFVMPEEFPATLRDFTREVLRDQPEDVAKYGYEYFLKKMEEAKAKAEGYAT